ncbi:hypothetical protein [uncultured Amaricoccus sp.]|uniref:hypothetical protein n=1 Tax=uncultured Amaricoccus sp. TaxID=339341 RepID=UPI002636F517|nr:hypothetical protein [uncultured Amaricoccus sp.]
MTRDGARAGALLLGLALCAQPLAAAEPRSAIPWLSESIVLIAAPPPARGGATPPAAGDPDAITVTPLGEVSRDAVGLLAPAATGFARNLWGPATAPEVRDLILEDGGAGVPEAIALFKRLMLAEADPPEGSDAGSTVLVARVDRLLEMGALDEANAMIGVAGPDSAELYRRWFDIGLLLDQAKPPCQALRENPTLSPTLPARVFCLARGGDWSAAEITLTLGKGVGSITPEQERLLARFLDPDLFEGEEDPPVPDPLTPLDFLLREAVGLPRPPGALPLAFLRGDLGEHVPMRTRVEAAERLWLSGALDHGELFAAYRSGAPAASGGVWDRAKAAQDLDTALGTGADIGPALAAADAAFSARGLRVALAREYGGRLAALPPTAGTRETLVELLLLAGDIRAARSAAGPRPEARTAALLAIAGDGALPASADDDRLRAAIEGLRIRTPSDEREQRLATDVAEGRQGEAVLAALELVTQGAAVDPPALRAALFTLREAGQAPAARAIALQTLLPGDAG